MAELLPEVTREAELRRLRQALRQVAPDADKPPAGAQALPTAVPALVGVGGNAPQQSPARGRGAQGGEGAFARAPASVQPAAPAAPPSVAHERIAQSYHGQWQMRLFWSFLALIGSVLAANSGGLIGGKVSATEADKQKLAHPRPPTFASIGAAEEF
uniref:Uncharacterized protein n=1 Tax=Pyrodinium bahamense TaxID=73915 RepID=A0A7S0B2L1_9DINO